MGIPMFLFKKKKSPESFIRTRFLDLFELWTLRPPVTKVAQRGRLVAAVLPRLEGCVSRNLFPKADRILKLMKDFWGGCSEDFRCMLGGDGLPGKCLVYISYPPQKKIYMYIIYRFTYI